MVVHTHCFQASGFWGSTSWQELGRKQNCPHHGPDGEEKKEETTSAFKGRPPNNLPVGPASLEFLPPLLYATLRNSLSLGNTPDLNFKI